MSTPRFIALTGEAASLKAWLNCFVPQRHSALRLNRVFDASDLVVFASPETPFVPLAEERGVIVGRLFTGPSACKPIRVLDLSASRHAAWSRGRSLLEGKWGNFVAFTRDEKALATLRDPSGTVPAYLAAMGALEICFSDLDLALGAGYEPSGLDEEFLRQWLTYPFLRTARTGLSGCEELPPGSVRISSGPARSVEALWSPWRAANAEREVRDFDTAARRLRDVALTTIPAQLAGIERPLLQLSGGLDSSIVATCLRRGGIDFTATTFATRTPEGDERDYARRLASDLEVELIEQGEDELPLDLSPPMRRTLRPPLNPVLQPLDRAFSRAARQSRSRDLVTGAGGDNLFCYLTTAAPALDAFERLPLRDALATLQDVAALGECTLWKAGRYAVRKRFRRRSRPIWARDERFLAPCALAAAPDPHPWLLPPEPPCAGKLEHVEALVRIHFFLRPRHASGEAMHHPLINQPLMEACLAIPSWLWVRGGRNRAVARHAFSDLLPPTIVRRRTKGSLAAMCSQAFVQNSRALADLLLGGELSRRCLIDERAVDAYLQSAGGPPNDNYFRIFDLASLELWLRSWRV
ncbi:MAG: hypothetical protein QOI38_1785 [Sphingomonadales bacterium]|jgi:asparagine synthase (glutamine-hydrolysing)|nr:hypothetical protein [Sphingomonadales bacterium]